MIDENELWLLSYYRTSEISGSLFFGRLARGIDTGRHQIDLTSHFADEAQHARYWTDCIDRLERRPIKLGAAYQDQYAAVAGLPTNLMEVMAVTQVFERRVINQYAAHLRKPELNPLVRDTIERIMRDEQWHLRWVRGALAAMKADYGSDAVHEALSHYQAADREVYATTMREHHERADALLGSIHEGGLDVHA